MQHTRHERTRSMLLTLGMLVAGLVLWQCGEGHGTRDTGTINLNLAARVNGTTYRLRDAVFGVSGPETLELSSDGSPGDIDDGETTSAGCSGAGGSASCGDALTASLLVGDYQILLREGWRLQRDSGSGFEDVAARLASANPVGFAISGGETTRVVFAFEADGRVIPFDRGALEVVLEVEEVGAIPVFDPAACDFDDLQGCEALACESVCPTNDGGSCSVRCSAVIECVSAQVQDGGCLPTEDDPMCGVRGPFGIPNVCTQVVEAAGGPNVLPPAPGQVPQPSFVARELVRCLCSTPRP